MKGFRALGVLGFRGSGFRVGESGDLVSSLGITGVTIWVIGVTNILTKSPWPSK